MAVLYVFADDTEKEIAPKNGKRFTVAELKKLIGGPIEKFEAHSADGSARLIVVTYKQAALQKEGHNVIIGRLEEFSA